MTATIFITLKVHVGEEWMCQAGLGVVLWGGPCGNIHHHIHHGGTVPGMGARAVTGWASRCGAQRGEHMSHSLRLDWHRTKVTHAKGLTRAVWGNNGDGKSHGQGHGGVSWVVKWW